MNEFNHYINELGMVINNTEPLYKQALKIHNIDSFDELNRLLLNANGQILMNGGQVYEPTKAVELSRTINEIRNIVKAIGELEL